MYFPLVILSMAFLVALAGAPWYAVNHSRPIGDLPYCWGTWVAVTSLISAAGMITLALLGLVWKPATPLGGPEAVVLAGYNYLVGLGLWRRKRYGVVLHLAPVKGVAITSLMMLATQGANLRRDVVGRHIRGVPSARVHLLQEALEIHEHGRQDRGRGGGCPMKWLQLHTPPRS